ncbi:hypothetical protein [Macrococcus equi]|uniref:hypothetical protein n=1 Tax=Macrococcus equi TaxID=3395462 RepID=UPI0039BDE639
MNIKINNPWNREYIKELLKQGYELNSKNEKFTWILEEDRHLIKNNCSSARFGIPTQVVGDYENAQIFLCLYNPGTHMKSKQSQTIKNVGNYIKEELALENKLESNFKKYAYMKKMNEYYDYNKEDILESDIEKYYKHIINMEDNILSLEIIDLFDLFVLKYSGKKIKNNIITNDEAKNISYYLRSYYSGAFYQEKKNSIQSTINFFENKFLKLIDMHGEKAREVLLNELRAYSICNMELLPYRSSIKSDIKFEKNGLINLTSTKFVVEIILNRLLTDTDEKPIFIFRSRVEWLKAIESYIRLNEKIMSYIDENYSGDINKFMQDKLYPNFYVFSSTNSGSMSPNNIVKLTDFKGYKHKNKKTDYVSRKLLHIFEA